MWIQSRSRLPGIVVVSTLVSVGLMSVAAAGPNDANGEVRGRVTAGPICPGPARLNTEHCARRSIQTTIEIFEANDRSSDPGEDRPIMLVATDREGLFQVTLAPGAYRLLPVSPGGISVGKPRDIVVTAGSRTNIELLVDTGLR